jgi:hypothetical protein
METTFLSSDGVTIYTVQLVGVPPASLTCTCAGYTMGVSCKHIDAVLFGGPGSKSPQPIDGFDDAANLLHNSPARKAYLEMLDEIRQVELEEKSLKAKKKAIKNAFYKKLAQGII